MGKNKINAERLSVAINNINRYFLSEKVQNLQSEDFLEFEPEINTEKLDGLYDLYIGNMVNRTLILDALALLSVCVKEDLLWESPRLYELIDEQIRIDLLRLYIMLNEDQDKTTWVSIRTSSGTTRLQNYCNWVFDDMIREYVSKHLTDINNLTQAHHALKLTKRKRGRTPNDPRLSTLIWGIYSLLRDSCKFNSPMPNKVCQFIIYYLQLINIIPLDSEIDTFWIRAQLRYVQSKNRI